MDLLLNLLLVFASFLFRQEDTLLITPTTQGIFRLPETGITLDIAYATVTTPTHLTVTRQDDQITIRARDGSGQPLRRFEMPLIVVPSDSRQPMLLGWPGGPLEFRPSDRWLVIFDAHGIYAQPANDADPDQILYLGPLEHYTPDLVQHDSDLDSIRYNDLPTPAHVERYRDRFVPEDRTNPGAFHVLGWISAGHLPTLVQALRATIPNDPDIPAPGEPHTPIPLILPFDCAGEWAVSWGYHHSTPQNRFAVDFALMGPTLGQPVYAAHAGTLYLKRYGTTDWQIDVGLEARIVAEDGITSTIYGHLDMPSTLSRWGLDDLPDFEWIEVGVVEQGQQIGSAGRTGYATGAHIHFALWSWDQSLYQPIPLGPLTEFRRGMQIPSRSGCDQYR
jgi:hypothetical protein